MKQPKPKPQRISFNYKPRLWQTECHARKERFRVFALHRRAGKTELGLIELIHEASKTKAELSLYAYVAPFLKQAKAIAWARLKQRLEPLRRVERIAINESELSVRFKHNGAVIRIIGADNPHAIRGVRLDGVVMDEVAQMRPEVWTDIIQPALSDRKGWAIFIGTPNGINLFSELFHKARSLPDWYSARYTVRDTDTLDPDEVDRLERDMAPSSFAREYLCDFSAAGDNQLIGLTDIEEASRRELVDADYVWSPRILGVDPARFGGDRSVIFPRQGLRAGKPVVIQGIDNMALASRVAQEAKDWNADAIFVDAGAGAGVIDRLRQLGVDCVEVPFAGRPIDQQYKNKRAEMWFLLSSWLESGSIPNQQELKQDLGAPMYNFDALGKKMLESKDHIKARGLPSPDLGDALALTFAMPVLARSDLDRFRDKNAQEGHEYDPLEFV
jgi:hypothetical protein